MADDQVEAMTKALAVWAKKKGIRVVDFQKSMGWSYNYAWRILHARDKFTPAAYGPFIVTYGLSELVEIYRIAGINPEQEKE